MGISFNFERCVSVLIFKFWGSEDIDAHDLRIFSTVFFLGSFKKIWMRIVHSKQDIAFKTRHTLPSFHSFFIHHFSLYTIHMVDGVCVFSVINFMISHLNLKCVFLVGFVSWLRCSVDYVLTEYFVTVYNRMLDLTEISIGSIDNYAERWLVKSLVCVFSIFTLSATFDWTKNA